MGKKTSKKKMTKAERRRIQRRRQMIRNGIVFGGIAAVCVMCLVMISVLNRPVEPQSSWYVGDGALEIAAPPMSDDGLRLASGDYAPTDDAPDDGDGSGGFEAAQDLPTRADGDGEAESLFEVPSFESEFGVAPDFGDDEAVLAVDTREIVADNGGSSQQGDDDLNDSFFSDDADLPDLPGLEDSAPQVQANPDGSTTITITAAGDCTFGGCLKHDTYKVFKKYVDAFGYEYFFQNVRSLFEADDLTIINLEGPLTDVGTMTTKSSICFRGDPEWTAIMTGSSVEVCNFANNHSMDMGQEGYDRTLQALDKAGIGYCAYSKVYRTTVKGVRISALGFDKWNNQKSEIVEAVRNERPNCDILIVNMHWGYEMKYKADSNQTGMGHAIIDAGADLVIGTHPHVYQQVEQYKGKYIVYSLGNFCFGGNTRPSDQRALMFQQVFNVSTEGEVTDGGINVIPCRVSGDTQKNDFQPYIMGKKEGKKLLKAVAKYSNLNKNTLWMTASYPEQIGLIKTAAGTAGASSGGDASASVQTAASDFAATGIDAAAQVEATKQPSLGSIEMTEDQKTQIQEQIYYDQMTK